MQALKSVSDAATEPHSRPKRGSNGPDLPAHLQKKLSRRISFMNRVKDKSIAASLAARGSLKKRRQQQSSSKALASLGVLAEALDTAVEEADQTAIRRRRLAGRGMCKKRTQITSTETVQLQQVLAHPEYQKDPFAAIQSQLHATLPAPPPERAGKDKRKQKPAGAAARRE